MPKRHEPVRLESRTMQRPDGAIRYFTAGPATASTIVFLHGAFLDHRLWSEQVATFSPAYRLLIPDLRCHGLSQPCGVFSVEDAAEDVIAMLQQEEVSSAGIVGHSLGGLVAQAVIRNAPEQVSALVAVGAPCAAAPRGLGERAGLALSRLLVRLMPASALYRAVGKACGPAPGAMAYAREAATQIPKRSFGLIWENGVVAALHPDPTEQFDLPVLLVVGEEDPAGTVKKDARYWAARDPKARTNSIPFAGHLPMLDQPNRFDEVLRAFL